MLTSCIVPLIRPKGNSGVCIHTYIHTHICMFSITVFLLLLLFVSRFRACVGAFVVYFWSMLCARMTQFGCSSHLFASRCGCARICCSRLGRLGSALSGLPITFTLRRLKCAFEMAVATCRLTAPSLLYVFARACCPVPFGIVIVFAPFVALLRSAPSIYTLTFYPLGSHVTFVCLYS